MGRKDILLISIDHKNLVISCYVPSCKNMTLKSLNYPQEENGGKFFRESWEIFLSIWRKPCTAWWKKGVKSQWLYLMKFFFPYIMMDIWYVWFVHKWYMNILYIYILDMIDIHTVYTHIVVQLHACARWWIPMFMIIAMSMYNFCFVYGVIHAAYVCVWHTCFGEHACCVDKLFAYFNVLLGR